MGAMTAAPTGATAAAAAAAATPTPAAASETASRFDAMFHAADDPWGYATRWYERRKRALLLAALPRERYVRAFEPGCANGVTSAALAERCDSVLAWDSSAEALARARHRCAGNHAIRFEQAAIPDAWPDGKFDLIVLNELGYYLDAPRRRAVADHARAALAADGCLVACHWRRPLDDGEAGGDAIHTELARRLDRAPLCSHVEADFRIDLWCDLGRAAARTPAEREGLA